MTEPIPDAAEALARLGHLEPALLGRSLLVLGGNAERDASRAWMAARGIEGSVLAEAEAEATPAGFERIVVHPGGGPLSPERIARLRALLAPAGLLAVALRPGDEGVEPLLRDAFPVVETAVLLPVPAWLVIPESPAPGEISWDGSGLGAPAAASRLLLCGSGPSGLRSTTVVAGPPLPAPALRGAPGLAEAALRARLENRVDELEAHLAALHLPP